MLEGFRGLRVVEHLLERRVHPLGLLDLPDGAAVVPRIRGSTLLGAEYERFDRCKVGQPVVALGVPEDGVEQPQRRSRREEVLHGGIPWAIAARDERETGVIVEQDEPRRM